MGQNDRKNQRSGTASRRTVLSASAVAAAAVPLAGGAAAHAAPSPDLVHGGPGRPARPQHPSRQLRALLRRVDADRIEATVRRLAAFGTRHTLSSQDDPARGIGAARDGLFEQMTGYAAASGGRMTVELQSYIQEPASRIPVPTRITNVVATLRGDVTPNRAYVITG
ncbi:MAG TPA: aminopeptidase, partial [Micromonosporaceae bacterium]|nr:aminopeptidase [Micromonosporaceae bacterium]